MTEHNEPQIFNSCENSYQEISNPELLSGNPTVSVKMITYKHGPYIAQAIQGVLMQETTFPVELVIGEDCSKDGTREILLNYQNRYPEMIRLIVSEKNVGARENSRRTEKACKGDFIAFCEGDDYWTDPLKLQKQVDFLEANLDYGMVHTDFDSYCQSSNEIEYSYNKNNKIEIPDGEIFEDLLGDVWLIHTQTVLVRADLAKSYQKFLTANVAQVKEWKFGDIPRFLYMAQHSKIKYFNESTAVYRTLNESMSHTKDKIKKIYNSISLMSIKIFFCIEYNADKNLLKKIELVKERLLLKKSFFLGDFTQARKSFFVIMHGVDLTMKDALFFLGSFRLTNIFAKKIILLTKA